MYALKINRLKSLFLTIVLGTGLIALLFITLTIQVPIVYSQGGNLIENGNFSTGTTDGWSTQDNPNPFDIEDENGDYYARIGGGGSVYQNESDNESEIYEFSFRCKSDEHWRGTRMDYLVDAEKPNVASYGKDINCPRKKNNRWVTSTARLLLDASDTYTVSFQKSEHSGGNRFRLDDVSLIKVSDVDNVDTGIITNGDFIGPDSWEYASKHTGTGRVVYRMDEGASPTQLGAVQFQWSNEFITQTNISIVESQSTTYTLSFNCSGRSLGYKLVDSSEEIVLSDNGINCQPTSFSGFLWDVYTNTVLLA